MPQEFFLKEELSIPFKKGKSRAAPAGVAAGQGGDSGQKFLKIFRPKLSVAIT
jgi:hypothetical protein